MVGYTVLFFCVLDHVDFYKLVCSKHWASPPWAK